jgi:hypothetical protein
VSKRIAAIVLVYLVATVGWVALGSTIVHRTESLDHKLTKEVGELWGIPLLQPAPWATLGVPRVVETRRVDATLKREIVERETVIDQLEVPLVASDIRVALELDQRQKGLLWYSTFRVRFAGSYTFENTSDRKGELTISFAFPAPSGIYDEFRFEVDGQPVNPSRHQATMLTYALPCEAKSRHKLSVNYYSQGLDRFVYDFGEGINEVRSFQFVALTDFSAIDFPDNTMSPTDKKPAGNGWELTWRYGDLITGNAIGIEMPKRINPGPMASRISYFAPVSLGFFFFLIFIIALLKRIEVHPMNYFFLAAAFFAFHLLLAYLVDHISIHTAFLICSAVSMFLVASYMRIVVGSRFAFVEVALAQVIYLVGFSYAFFVEGFTGLAVTIGAIATLFVVMQLTARIKWSEKFNQVVEEQDRPA